MLDALIRFSLRNRFGVLLAALALLIYGAWVATRLPVDVFPNLNRPTVSILAEAHGLAPEEVEPLVTLPIESALNGTPGVVRTRSSSGVGLSIVHVEFEWGSEIYRNRQLVAERLQLVQGRLPRDVTPVLGPVSSVMGEIQFVGLQSPTGVVSPMDLRSLADWVVRPRLMTIPGVSQVIVLGGEVKQFQIQIDPRKLLQHGLTIKELRENLEHASLNTSGGFIDQEGKEFLVRPLGRIDTLEELEGTAAGYHFGMPILLKHIATVKLGPMPKRGEGSVNGKHAVVMTIQKQPEADTVELTKRIDEALGALQASLPEGATIEADLFKQSRFIEASIANVNVALRDGAIIVAIVLILFLANVRTTAITLVTIPLSLAVTALVFKWLGFGINTMTLGGLAVAIGELVDDAIVDVENVHRRLGEHFRNRGSKSVLRVIFEASSEVRNSIILSTIIVVLVFLPLFFLSGIEGRLFAPLGVAYIISLIASLVVSLTVTPVLCSYLLGRPDPRAAHGERDTRLVQTVKRFHRHVLERSLGHPRLVIGSCLALVVGALALLPFMGRSFLPAFNEGTATLGVASAPGIALADSDRLGTKIEETLLAIPEVKSTIRRTGRAELDEHAEGVHWNEVDVDFKDGGRDRQVVLQEIREKVEALGDVYVNLGQPISHRLDHLLSGVRAQIALKIFGPDLAELRRLGALAEAQMQKIPGLVDLSLEPLVLIPQLKIALDKPQSTRLGVPPGEIAEDLEAILAGETVSQVLEGQRTYDITLRMAPEFRNDPDAITNLPMRLQPNGDTVIYLRDIAEVYPGQGPNLINRENMQRRIVVSANASGRDLGSLVQEIRAKMKSGIEWPPGYYFELGGQFESQQEASRLLLGFGILALFGILGVLYASFRSLRISLQIMINVPLAFVGSVFAIYATERELSVATLIAFITLCGIASRNGIMMVSHYLHLIRHEGEAFSREMVIRGSLERIVPVLMTALTAAVALVPFALSKGEAGKEILYPVAVVILGGLFSSTLLDLVVTPCLFLNYGQKATERWLATHASGDSEEGV